MLIASCVSDGGNRIRALVAETTHAAVSTRVLRRKGIVDWEGETTMVLQKAFLWAVCSFCVAVASLVSGAEAVSQDTGDGGAEHQKASKPAAATDPGPADAEATARAEILQSNEMLLALIWWEDHFAASAEDGKQAMEQLQGRLAKMSSLDLRRFLLRFQWDRDVALDRRASDEVMRREKMVVRQESIRRNAAAREAALDRAYYSDRRYFATTSHHFGGAPRYFGRTGHYYRRPTYRIGSRRRHH